MATGDMLREQAPKRTPLGTRPRRSWMPVEIVSDDIMVGMIKDQAGEQLCVHKNGIRSRRVPSHTCSQAQKLDGMLSAEGEARLRRATPDRRSAAHFAPPKKPMTDDITGEPLIQRSDDNVETLTKRLSSFHSQTGPVVDYYKAKGLWHGIDAAQAPAVVWENMRKTFTDKNKRKLKCDGTRPVCVQCVKMNREVECEYDDKKQKSRTQKLKDKLSQLEERLRELESESSHSSESPGSDQSALPATQRSSPELVSTVGAYASNSAVLESPGTMPLAEMEGVSGLAMENLFETFAWPTSSSSSSLYSSTSGYETPALDLDQVVPDPEMSFFEMSPFSSVPANPDVPYMPQWDQKEPLPFESRRILLDIFMAHRHQCWFDCQMDRFLPVTSSTQPGREPHPALMNAIYLLACHFARSPYCTEIELVLLHRTLHEITIALDASDRLVDVVQASCLLATYLYINCRALEGYCHSFSAARLAVGVSMHQIRGLGGPTIDAAPLYNTGTTPIPIPAARDQAELEDRAAAFWQSLPDGDSPQLQINTPWPGSPLDGSMLDASQNTIGSLFDLGALEADLAHIPALRVKAAALYERTFRLSNTVKKTDAYWLDYQAAEMALDRFCLHLPPFVGYESWENAVAADRRGLVCDPHDAFQAASSVLGLIRQLTDGDYQFLDPTLSACWSTVARTYVRLLAISGQEFGATTMYTVSVIEQDLEAILNAMKTLSAFFPWQATTR
ncbi:unnamed protein product [Mycena citricolor]|uniref:Zn(2)-C6 fungal-type domain-containing protein n=1 Tax=Mycena citricolor TaxID=2018698 RepID=A0AAD2HQK1_9AGAR|nr:unnamed protein product [Mycena citricolor]